MGYVFFYFGTPCAFHITKSVLVNGGKTSKKSLEDRIVSPYFSLKFYRLPTTSQQNALVVSMPLLAGESYRWHYGLEFRCDATLEPLT